MKCQWIKLTFSLIPQHQYPRHRMERQGHIPLCIYFRFIQPIKKADPVDPVYKARNKGIRSNPKFIPWSNEKRLIAGTRNPCK
uniref:Uncharacterized protein n=1 Tax=Picea glauca TaxID=3330 RepID=A0A101LXI0_PICGL|nr:hypothetical protein ABT39_MTgene6166 [Picea glauca]